MNQLYKDFPPGWHHIMVPQSSTEAALAAMAIYTGSKRRSLLFQRLASSLVSVFGPKALPGKVVRWQPPLEEAVWDGLLAEWTRELQAFDALAVYLRRQTSREGFSVLLIDGSDAVAFVKLQPGSSDDLSGEYRAQEQIHASQPRSFRVPAPRFVGELGGWAYLAMDPLPARIHTPAMDAPLDLVLRDIQRGIELDARPATVPPHWVPMHGDLTPWNLRKSGDDRYLLDWERVGWGPPGADEALFRVAIAALRHRRVKIALSEEAVRFWRDQIGSQPETGGRDRLRNDLLGELNRSPVA